MTASSPRVTAVVPAYNAARTLARTLESALTQTLSDLEVVVVDDGSSDATCEVVAAITDTRVRLVSQRNAGVAAARNTGIDNAKGEWIAFLDSDDIWLPGKLERQLELMSARAGCLASQGSAYFVDDDLRPLKLRRCVPVADPLLAFLRFQNLPNAASSWIVKRELLAEIGGFDPNLAILEDWEFSLRLARYANPLCIDEPLTLYRVHPGNRSRDLDLHIQPGFTVLDRLFADPDLPAAIKQREDEIYARFYTMLCGGALKVHRWWPCLLWGARALRRDPHMITYIAQTPIRRATRRLAAGRDRPDLPTR